MKVKQFVTKAQSYKYPAWRQKLELRMFGYSNNTLLTVTVLVDIIDKVLDMREEADITHSHPLKK